MNWSLTELSSEACLFLDFERRIPAVSLAARARVLARARAAMAAGLAVPGLPSGLRSGRFSIWRRNG